MTVTDEQAHSSHDGEGYGVWRGDAGLLGWPIIECAWAQISPSRAETPVVRRATHRLVSTSHSEDEARTMGELDAHNDRIWRENNRERVTNVFTTQADQPAQLSAGSVVKFYGW